MDLTESIMVLRREISDDEYFIKHEAKSKSIIEQCKNSIAIHKKAISILENYGNKNKS